ncbi:hypothetical protein [Streptomyces fuscigenes]|uniref:hypothetical protein n=1 Tax=Streptomyces fuscigenes TaxID=1528880 RepID=UPI001F488BA0|nr:hypothetical protein [Streptomyces fuscigenes]MCF3960600.1 hypothetical protein [Streptomyces fuscigenes]
MTDTTPELPGPPWPWPGCDPTPDPITAWVQYEDGSLGSITVTGGQLPELARPGRLITQAEFETLNAAMSAAHTSRLQDMAEEETARQTREYQDLRKAGIPEETARRLSGYTGSATA